MSRIAMVIPARIGSTRLPQKALADIEGVPMVVRVARQAAQVKNQLPAGITLNISTDIFVATDSTAIQKAVESAGFQVAMTPAELASGTDRVAYVARSLPHDIIVNVQGDEPVVAPMAIAAAIEGVFAGRAEMGSAMTPFQDEAEFNQRGCVKVITDKVGNAIYFSRSPIPFRQGDQPWSVIAAERKICKHLGIYAFTKDFLQKFTRLEPSYLEKLESLEQLRALYHGHKICMGFSEKGSIGVDTAEDLEKVRRFVRENNL